MTALDAGERLELRCCREEKRVLAAAAAYERVSLATFVLRAALEAAEGILGHRKRSARSVRDSARALKLLENPTPPTAALPAAAARRRHKS